MLSASKFDGDSGKSGQRGSERKRKRKRRRESNKKVSDGDGTELISTKMRKCIWQFF
jgi:hypothetical protein